MTTRKLFALTLRLLAVGLVIYSGRIAYETWFPFAKWEAHYALPFWQGLWFSLHPFVIMMLATLPAHLADFVQGCKPTSYVWIPGMKW